MRPYRANPIEEEESEFVYGGHCELGDRAFIVPPDAEYDPDYGGFEPVILGVIEVRPETVSQYIGLRDKNEKEIYGTLDNEGGDIVRLFDEEVGTITQDGIFGSWGIINHKHFRSVENIYVAFLDKTGLFSAKISDMWEVIGNTHQNPELLESKE